MYRPRVMAKYRDSNEAIGSIFLPFLYSACLLASFSKLLPPHDGKMVVIPPTYIFSGSGPIAKVSFSFLNSENKSPEPGGRVSILKQFLEQGE